MGLTSETNRIVQEFEYNNVDLNQGVQEFLSQMGMLRPRLLICALNESQLMLFQTRALRRTARA